MELNFSISFKREKITLNDIDENLKIKDIKTKLSKVSNNDVKNFNFIHKGQILNEDVILKDIGIVTGSMIYCFPKNVINVPSTTPLSIIEVQQLLVSLRAAVTNSNFRLAIQKLRKPEKIAKLLSECPALHNDPASLIFVQDADLVSSLQNAECLSKTVEERPVLGRVLQIVCNLITSEITSPRRSHHVSYSMDALSDDDMDVDQSDELRNSLRSGSSQLITPAQLAAALANATGSNNWGGFSSAPISGLTTPSSIHTPFNTPAPGSSAAGGASPGGSLITTEMFSQALQNALAASATRGPNSLAGPYSGVSQNSAINHPLENIEESLQLMREMGIPDSELCLQALQATNGDVQAAVNLIFSQWMADD